VLGWLAERLPHLVREIHEREHEVASHGYCHELCGECTIRNLRKDLTDSKKLLEDIIGNQIYGYRAPSFSINDGILKAIEDCGYLYDSSFNSFAMHGRYGSLSLNANGKRGIAYQVSDSFFELPISNLSLRHPFSYVLSAISSEQNRGSFVLPWGGGGYFRLIPFPIFRLGVHRILKMEQAYLFYIHPWEIDSAQPRVNEVPRLLRFRHYANLNQTQFKLTKFLETFNNCRFLTCYQYLQEMGKEYHHSRSDEH
jgi:polysaccharide deacetylase family protein (PEP-CTERM system associated)